MAALRNAVAPYPLRLLGEWSFYLVLAPDWKLLAVAHGGPAVSPASSLLVGKAKVMDRSLFAGSADRNIELEKWSGITVGPKLIDIAITHVRARRVHSVSASPCADAVERIG